MAAGGLGTSVITVPALNAHTPNAYTMSVPKTLRMMPGTKLSGKRLAVVKAAGNYQKNTSYAKDKLKG